MAFGELFEPATVSGLKAPALNFLLSVQQVGGTSAAGDSAIQPYKIIVGSYQTRINNIKTAMQLIMQGGVQIALIQ